MSKPRPEFVYRLASAAEWREAQASGVAPKRDIDLKDGYMHLSTKEQALETARLHFAGVDDLLALEIPLAPIADDVKFELAPKRGEAFPHLYRDLRREDVAAVIPLRRDGEGFSFGEPQ
ncbi:DUF952 domain-containing protein [Hyphococcus luteus]|uniref:DUF952 domain-containing protein n=1 Tax=Hyphococcus luteus TaxID=2058213 RepID=A0A2S7K5W2_9PROT|nr:DUF952 domain-containing protein [Marinicaulis flavus]PQA87866.1 DUF952 domain-containing protein [Marinicaulis flavus]